jgi:N-acetylmuramic acid 6-phosphate etherase
VNERNGTSATETSAERYSELDRWPIARTVEELVDANRRAIEAVAAARPPLVEAAEAIADRVADGGRLIYAGAGTSGRLALQDAAELPPTFGFDRTVVLLAGGELAGAKAREGAEDDVEAAAREVAAAEVGPRDSIIAIAASGRTPYTVAALERAGERGALTVGIANNPATPLLAAARFPVCLDTGPEVLAGSTRLAAGTAQKVALNTLSTAVLVKLGGAYRNLMVGMAQSNDKLRRRAVAIVDQATGAGEERSRAALQGAGGSVRVAIVCLRTGLGREQALDLLAQHQNRVRDVLEALGEAGSSGS